jgi:2-phosphosulfolactate phosphatase
MAVAGALDDLGHRPSSVLTVHVDAAFTPDEAAAAPVGIVVDVIRASSTIAQALAAGYERILCCASIEEARALRAQLDDAVVGGERDAVRIEGFDVGASPREFLEPKARTLILSTTNGTRAILAAAARCGEVLIGSLLNLRAVADAARERGEDVTVLCAGYKGRFALDDEYCAGRILQHLDGDRGDAAIAAELIARAFPDAAAGLNARRYGPPGLEADIAYCAQEDLVSVVPRLSSRLDGVVELRG